jgi:L-asparagine oxygenase
VSEYCLLLLTSALGEPIGYQDEKEGFLIHDISPIPGREAAQENAGSVPLEFHTENAFHPHRPDFVCLYCLRTDGGRDVLTITASSRRALPLLTTADIWVLRQPLFHIAMPPSFRRNGDAPVLAGPAPVLSGDEDRPELRFDLFGTRPTSPPAQGAMERLSRALLDVSVGAALEPGQVIIVDNRIAVHGRTGFAPRYDGADRWLQRLFVVHDLRRSLPMRPAGSHVCRPFGDARPGP